jgi:hypothetical protein
VDRCTPTINYEPIFSVHFNTRIHPPRLSIVSDTTDRQVSGLRVNVFHSRKDMLKVPAQIPLIQNTMHATLSSSDLCFYDARITVQINAQVLG